MNELQKAAQQALQALESYQSFIDDAHIIEGQWGWLEGNQAVITALREALSSSKDSSALAKHVEHSTATRELFAVPPGYALVPVEPTPEMEFAVEKAETRHYLEDLKRGGNDPELSFHAAYCAALAAAPQPKDTL